MSPWWIVAAALIVAAYALWVALTDQDAERLSSLPEDSMERQILEEL